MGILKSLFKTAVTAGAGFLLGKSSQVKQPKQTVNPPQNMEPILKELSKSLEQALTPPTSQPLSQLFPPELRNSLMLTDFLSPEKRQVTSANYSLAPQILKDTVDKAAKQIDEGENFSLKCLEPASKVESEFSYNPANKKLKVIRYWDNGQKKSTYDFNRQDIDNTQKWSGWFEAFKENGQLEESLFIGDALTSRILNKAHDCLEYVLIEAHREIEKKKTAA